MSGEQWAYEACLPRGIWVMPPTQVFEKVGALRLILVGFGNHVLS